MSEHKFQSISHSQWKSGTLRRNCAQCKRNYDDPVHPESPTVSSWPLVVVIEDCFVPEWSEEILDAVAATSPETSGAAIYALAVYAEMGLRGERLN